MASVIDALNEALSEDKSAIKILLYSIPIYFCAHLFVLGKLDSVFYTSVFLTAILMFALLSKGINNVRMNRREVLCLNPLNLISALIKSFIVVVPYILVLGFCGLAILKYVKIPFDIPHISFISEIIVWSILGSIFMTAYMSFSKYLRILQAFNVKVIFESCVDVFVSLLFFVPQLVFVDAVLIAPIAYLFNLFNLPYNHWGFVYYCSIIFIVNISVLANYLAQAAYEHIKGSNEEYDDNHQINLVVDSADRMK